MPEKTQKPTPKKLRDARKRGEVAKSRELTSLGLFVALSAFLWYATAFMGEHVLSVVERAITAPSSTDTGSSWPWLHETQSMLRDMMWAIMPFLGLGLGCALLIGAAQTRGIFSLEPITPKFERINPGQGLKNIFSTRQLFELGKMVVKTALLLGALVACVAFSLDTMVKMVYAPAADLLRISGIIAAQLMGWAALIYAIGAALDYGHQHHEFMKQQKMSIDELRREYRDTEGDPHIKAHRRATGREMAYSKMSGRVSSSSVVVANPTHVCVALYYAQGETDLPRVVAKGVDALALKIRAEAERGGVPVLEDPALARLLFRKVPLDQYISEDLIDAIAAVIRWAREVDRRESAPRQREVPREQAIGSGKVRLAPPAGVQLP